MKQYRQAVKGEIILIERVTLKMQAYSYLKKQITDGILKPDEIYTEQGFAEMLNISRTPVREAVLQLAHEDFVSIKPNKGFMVREYSEREIEEYLQVRNAIEGFCGMYAADTAGSEKWEKLIETLEGYLKRLHEMMQREITPQEFMETDLLFHIAIVSYSGNSQMLSIIKDMRYRMDRIGLRAYSEGGTFTNAYSEHVKIVEAIKAGKRNDVYRAIEVHLDKYREVLSRV